MAIDRILDGRLLSNHLNFFGKLLDLLVVVKIVLLSVDT